MNLIGAYIENFHSVTHDKTMYWEVWTALRQAIKKNVQYIPKVQNNLPVLRSPSKKGTVPETLFLRRICDEKQFELAATIGI